MKDDPETKQHDNVHGPKGDGDGFQKIRGFEYLSPVADFLTAFADMPDARKDDSLGITCSVSRIKLDLPFEVGIRTADSGDVALGCAPPTQKIETGIMPVFHRLRITLEPNDDI